jgi:hypothetical protein
MKTKNKYFVLLRATVKSLECLKVALFVKFHGNSACDWVGGTLERLAEKASLHSSFNDQIMTPHQLYEWTQSSIHNLNFDSVTQNEYIVEEVLLSD